MTVHIVTERYTKKPIFVDAVQVTEENFEEMARWCQGEIRNSYDEKVEDFDNVRPLHIRVRVHQPKTPRQTKAFVGDWLLYSGKGYKVYTDKAFRDSFEKTYQPGVTEGKSFAP